jgi:hypothetical protein
MTSNFLSRKATTKDIHLGDGSLDDCSFDGSRVFRGLHSDTGLDTGDWINVVSDYRLGLQKLEASIPAHNSFSDTFSIMAKMVRSSREQAEARSQLQARPIVTQSESAENQKLKEVFVAQRQRRTLRVVDQADLPLLPIITFVVTPEDIKTPSNRTHDAFDIISILAKEYVDTSPEEKLKAFHSVFDIMINIAASSDAGKRCVFDFVSIAEEMKPLEISTRLVDSFVRLEIFKVIFDTETPISLSLKELESSLARLINAVSKADHRERFHHGDS